MLQSCAEQVASESGLERTEQDSERAEHLKLKSRDQKGVMRGPKIELDQLLSDPSIRESLRSDGYYKRHQQKPHRAEAQKDKDPKSTLYKNIPLGFVKNLSP